MMREDAQNPARQRAFDPVVPEREQGDAPRKLWFALAKTRAAPAAVSTGSPGPYGRGARAQLRRRRPAGAVA